VLLKTHSEFFASLVPTFRFAKSLQSLATPQGNMLTGSTIKPVRYRFYKRTAHFGMLPLSVFSYAANLLL
jgi:hypothetical protein